MSCLNLRLPPAKKAWKSFTSKLLHKLRTSRKSIKKTNKRYRVSASATTTTSAKAIIFKRGDRRTRSVTHPYHTFAAKRHSGRFQFKKKSAPVYVDKLFLDPATELVTEYQPTSSKNVKLAVPDREEHAKRAEIRSAGDEMWESLGFASPQMRGIDERAEQFISRFRAEMALQEKMAGGL